MIFGHEKRDIELTYTHNTILHDGRDEPEHRKAMWVFRAKADDTTACGVGTRENIVYASL